MEWFNSNNHLLIIGSSIVGLSWVCYFGYKFGKRKLNEYIVSKVFNEMDERMKKMKGFVPVKNGKAAEITFAHGGKESKIYIPYDRKSVTKYSKYNFYLIKNDEKININQKSGVKYMVSAKDLGGEKITMEDKSGKEIVFWENDEIPSPFPKNI